MTHPLPISRLTILRYRSFEAATVDFSNPTVFVGRNGSGKSNLTDVFRFISEAMEAPLHAVIDRRGGYDAVGFKERKGGRAGNLGLAFEFGQSGGMASGRYAFELKAFKGYRYEVLREQALVVTPAGDRWHFEREKGWESNAAGLNPALKPTSLALPLVGGDERFEPIFRCLSGIRTYAIEPAALRQPQDPDAGETLVHDGGNAASVLRELARSPDGARLEERILGFLQQIAPEIVGIAPKKQGTKMTLEFKQSTVAHGDLTFEAPSMSDGTLRAVGLILAAIQRPSPTVLVVEEPEAAIHPGASAALMDALREAASNTQVLITTHSPDLLDTADDLETNLRIVGWADGRSHVAVPDDPTKKAIRSHLMGAGELLRSNALREEPLFVGPLALANQRLFEDVR